MQIVLRTDVKESLLLLEGGAHFILNMNRMNTSHCFTISILYSETFLLYMVGLLVLARG